MRYDLSRRASAQIDEIIQYTDKYFGQEQTAEYIGGLYLSFDLLTDNPKLGKSWAQGRRCYIYRSHYVFYRIEEDRIFITDIRNTRQQIPPEWRR